MIRAGFLVVGVSLGFPGGMFIGWHFYAASFTATAAEPVAACTMEIDQ